MSKKRKLSDIRKKIADGSAKVITVQELIDSIAKGEKVQFEDVDVITTATKGLMSGITGILELVAFIPNHPDPWVEEQRDAAAL